MKRTMQNNKLSKSLLIELYRRMVRIRAFESKVTQLFLKGLVPGTIHLSTGQEAVAVGATGCLRATDRVMLTHRPHGQALAKGMDPKRLLAEILGREGGCCRGKGGSMHLADPKAGIMPSLPIVGAGIPVAAGIAFAFKQGESDSVAMGFFGDGATNIGAFHEAMNLAALWKLPVVYVCENNLYAVSTRIHSATLVAELSEKAKMYGMPATAVDGNDVEVVYQAVSAAVERARRGEGPSFIECKTYRHSGHSRTDPATYRDEQEVQAWKKRDPLILCRKMILDRGCLDEKGCSDLEAEEEQLIEEAAEFALCSPEPEGLKALEDVYQDG
ncbi:MAG: thiamine pyrophosphate-dependent dehydrogenase E1 component subunit alpha [Spirochaetaceae bacterium]|nr:MAG: thiamine pyrophosphate-dependent dehydrogenase E1 component subunit alpha [Spirochaetaceae bacterium]